jgi:molecular chaperone DnaK
VTARDLATGREQSIQVNPAGGLSKEEIDRMIAEADRMRKDDVRRRGLRLLRNRLEGLLYTNERVFKEFGSLLEAGIGEKVKEALERGRRVLDAEDAGILQEAIDAVENAARHLTEVMLMDPSRFLSGMGGGSALGGDSSS